MYLQIHRTENGCIRYPLHTHKNYEIMLYLNGSGSLCTSEGDYPFEEGTVLIVPPGVSHGSTSKTGFRNISVEGEFQGYFCFDSVKVLADNESHDGQTLAKMLYENRCGSIALLNSLCQAYLCFLIERMEVEDRMYRSVERIVAMIREHAFDPQLRVSEILSTSGYAEDYIRAAFKKIIGKTPMRMLTEIRIHHACFLMDVYKHEMPLSRIAELCGFLDYVYFSKKFKALMGMTPRAYLS
ncbi:MAG: helix-turn-helix domain-containing protein [Clostridia bacterium]|nr:helix-turn-helix domain-containing protein [Clostridia bacterium]